MEILNLKMQQIRYSKGGFTFLEILAVIALVGLVSSLAVPKFSEGISNYRLKSVAKELRSDLRYIQQVAMAEGDFYEIRFYIYATPQQYTIHKSFSLQERKHIPPGIEVVGTTSFPGNPPTVRFNQSGVVNAGGTVIFKNSYGKRIEVITSVNTGRVILREL